MPVKVQLKFIKISPTKVSPLISQLRNKLAKDSLDKLQFAPQKSAYLLVKLLKSGIAAAKAKDIDINKLIITNLTVSQGPRLKRYIAVSKGRALPIRHCYSHITLILDDKKAREIIKKKETKK
jgi:large subunit ribosomal protein L22